MNLLINANISWRILKILINYFPNIKHGKDLEVFQPAKDIDIWNFCKQNDYTIITHDDDFEKIVLTK
jgi:predicted nuclease of predicted toxin-antitoxin system